MVKKKGNEVVSGRSEKQTQGQLGNNPSRIPENDSGAISTAEYSGPLPPPTMFKDYDIILPGAAERIISMAEKEQSIREHDNTKTLENDRLRIKGSIFISILLVLAAVFCAYINQPLVGIALVGSGVIVGIIRAFNI